MPYNDDDSYDDDDYYEESYDDELQTYGGRFINSYSYKPEPRFFQGPGDYVTDPEQTNGRVFMGMELEITIRDARVGAQLVTEAVDDNLIYCKEDGSVSGFEMVTHPMTLEAARQILPFDTLRTLRNEYSASGYQNGIHIHVNRTAFKSNSHAYRWAKFLYWNEEHALCIARRSGSHWASWATGDTLGHKNMMTVIKQGGRNSYRERYSAINVNNQHTFEVRIFRGTLNERKIMACLELIEGSVEYTRTLTASDVLTKDALKWDAFLAWAINQGDKYANLIYVFDHTEERDRATYRSQAQSDRQRELTNMRQNLARIRADEERERRYAEQQRIEEERQRAERERLRAERRVRRTLRGEERIESVTRYLMTREFADYPNSERTWDGYNYDSWSLRTQASTRENRLRSRYQEIARQTNDEIRQTEDPWYSWNYIAPHPLFVERIATMVREELGEPAQETENGDQEDSSSQTVTFQYVGNGHGGFSAIAT